MEETKEIKKKVTKKPVATKSKKVTTSTPNKKQVVVENVKKDVKTNVNVATSSENPIQEVNAFAAISLVLGAASLITWLYPILGISIGIPGLVIGMVTHETKRSNYSLLGIVTSLVGIVLSVVKAINM